MKKILSNLLSVLILVSAHTLYAQRLPKGSYRPNRERAYDIIHYKADIQLDWSAKKVLGESTVSLQPLEALSSFSFDAYWLNVTEVRALPGGKTLQFSLTDSTVVINLNRMVQPSETLNVAVKYSAVPSAGLYFVDTPARDQLSSSVYTYGEGGLHANWLPIYGDPNDKFSTEMVVTVPNPYVAISNGRLVDLKKNADGTKTFHWLQERPHSNYLITLNVAEYDSVQLRPAFGSIPLTCWIPRGRKEEGRFAFRNTTAMVEFFSDRFDYRYPWDKYDQVVAYDYAIGAMENTSATGHRDCLLRSSEVPDDFEPQFDNYCTNWSAEAIISHELAHHWFGDNLTCRSLASIWLNESFATYCMMLWDEHRGGEEFLQFQTWLALQAYLDYVTKEHIIRPMEYRRYDSREEIYNEQHTYLKGGILLHMLRWILGDDAFFKAMSYYLQKHEFSNVESSDLKIAIEEATGKNLEWFFDQWVYGGGHPRFEVEYQYYPDRSGIELTVRQTQSQVTGQGLFTLPVEIRVDTKSRTVVHTIWVKGETEHFFLKVDEKPQLVSFDGRGLLIRDLMFEKEPSELTYQLRHDALPGRLWALRQLVSRYPSMPQTVDAIKSILISEAPWWLKAEATLQLRHVHTPPGEQLLLAQLGASDYHVRKAAAIALGSHYTKTSVQALQKAVESDPQVDVAAAAIVSLAKIDPSLTPDFFRKQMSRHSWYDELRIASLLAIEKIGAEKFAEHARENFSPRFNMMVRQAALSAWAACAPADSQLHEALIGAAQKEVLRVRQKAIELLGRLKVARAIPALEQLSVRDGDGDIRRAAADAIEEIERVSKNSH